MRRCMLLLPFCAALVSTCAPVESESEQLSQLLNIDTPDKGYLNLPVRITDRSTAAALTFDPLQDEPATISYRLTRDGLIRVRVVWRRDPNLVLRTLLDWTHQDFGLHRVTWDGRDASGNLIDNRGAFVSFEGDDPRHLAHPVSECHELDVQLLEPSGGIRQPDSRITARMTRVTSFGRRDGFTLRCYEDYDLRREVRLPPETETFALPCAPGTEAKDRLFTINLDDGAGHVGVASLRLRRSEAKADLDRGRALFFQRACDACHDLDSGAWREDGPGLHSIGSRRPGDYLSRVIRAPRTVNRTSRMPEDDLSEETVSALVLFLTSLQRPAAADRHGSRIYLDEGCADCHETGAEFGSMLGPALQGIARLRTDSYLEEVVLRPQQLFPGTAMPPTLLQPGELSNLIEYLREL